MPTGLVEYHDGVLIGDQPTAELVEEQAHRLGRDDRHDQREAIAGGRPHRAEQVHPGVALVAKSRRPLPARLPAVADPAQGGSGQRPRARPRRGDSRCCKARQPLDIPHGLDKWDNRDYIRHRK
jgi:hypothetical protein